MQQSGIVAKFLVPFAQNDSAKVEIPVTSSDSTRASQSLGFPPLTMQPPESGGVPPQGEDFNGAMNQVARVAWWLMSGNRFPFDSTFAVASQIGGYAKGATLPSADLQGAWVSTADNNTINPDTDTGLTGWVPSFQYGVTALTGLTGGTVTLTGAQVCKSRITLAGALTSNLTLVFPTWVHNWTLTNNTSGNYTVTAKTSGGSGVVILQNGSATPIVGDGTNIVQPVQNVLVAPSQAASAALQVGVAQLLFAPVVGQVRNLNASAGVNATTVPYTAEAIVVATALGGQTFTLPSFSATLNLANTGINGMDTGTLTANAWGAVYAAYNPTTKAAGVFCTLEGTKAATTIYSGSNLPAGFTATALIGFVFASNTTGQVVAFSQKDRIFYWGGTTPLNGGVSATSTATTVGVSIPYAGRKISGSVSLTISAAGNGVFTFNGDANGAGAKLVSVSNGSGAGGNLFTYDGLLLSAPKTFIYYVTVSGTLTVTYQVYVTSFEF